ncbi:hypothetical protein BGX38DRAFT_1190040 [Terfezia claveryi]|nr:hypothetical protein BGX38DRAFT_1190040 [Terfezia claveryi]
MPKELLFEPLIQHDVGYYSYTFFFFLNFEVATHFRPTTSSLCIGVPVDSYYYTLIYSLAASIWCLTTKMQP